MIPLVAHPVGYVFVLNHLYVILRVSVPQVACLSENAALSITTDTASPSSAPAHITANVAHRRKTHTGGGGSPKKLHALVMGRLVTANLFHRCSDVVTLSRATSAPSLPADLLNLFRSAPSSDTHGASPLIFLFGDIIKRKYLTDKILDLSVQGMMDRLKPQTRYSATFFNT